MPDPTTSPGALLRSVRPPAHDWLYYRIHVTDPEAADRLLECLVAPMMRTLQQEVPGLRWFFLRFLDPSGLHVRLRIRAEQQALNACERRLDSALTAGRQDLPGLFESSGKFLYAPEVHKYGPGAGMQLAEELFQASSEMAVSCLGERHRANRVGYGAAHMKVLLAGLPAQQRPAFLHQYAWYWSGGPLTTGRAAKPRFAPTDARAAVQASRLASQLERALADPATRAALEHFAARFWTAMEGRERRAATGSDSYLLFHHMHLTNNRLGVFPGVEAALARLMWLSAGRLW